MSDESEEDDQRRSTEARKALETALTIYAEAMDYGVVTKWVVGMETNNGAPALRHRSGDMMGGYASPWDELGIHEACAVGAREEIRRQIPPSA